MNKFEDNIRRKVEEVDFTYKPADWESLQNSLPTTKKAWYSMKWFQVAAAVVVMSTVALFLMREETDLSPKLVKNLPQSEVIEKTEETSNLEAASTTPLIDKHSSEKEQTTQSTIEEDKNSSTQPSEAVNQDSPVIVSKEVEKVDLPLTPASSSMKQEESIEPSQQLKMLVSGKNCLGNEMVFTSNLEGNHQWKFNGELMSADKASITLAIEKTGDYHIEYTLGDIAQWDSTFKVNSSTKIELSYEDLKGPYDDESGVLTALPKALNYSWHVKELEGEMHGNPLLLDFEKAGNYNIEATALDEFGCESSLKKMISIQSDFDPLAPNRFTPDGDGINDDFMPEGFKQVDYETFHFYIYNPSGELVYATNSTDAPWNGTKNNQGEKLLSEHFVWKVVLSNKVKEKTFSGKVKIVSF